MSALETKAFILSSAELSAPTECIRCPINTCWIFPLVSFSFPFTSSILPEWDIIKNWIHSPRMPSYHPQNQDELRRQHSRTYFLIPSSTSDSISYPKYPLWGPNFSNTGWFVVSWGEKKKSTFTLGMNIKITFLSKGISSPLILCPWNCTYPIQISLLREAFSNTSTNTFLFRLTLPYISP